MLREALTASFADLMTDLGRLVERLSGTGRQPLRTYLADPAETAPAPDSTQTPLASAEPAARACAVIGCRHPARSLGYCAAHYQKRRLMVATGRLHREWVEDAAPHSLPDVILTRRRREDMPEEAPPVEAAPQSDAPRVWVRKKGVPVTPDASPEAASRDVLPAPRRGPPTPPKPEGHEVTSTVERWAAEFRAGKRGG